MNQAEALTLVSYLNRAGLLQALEGQAPVWADALDDVNSTDAQVAARAIAKTTARWITPGDIRLQVASIRRERTARIETPQPPPTIPADDVARQITWQREYIRAIGDGLTEDAADVVACAAVGVTRPLEISTHRPVDQLVEQVAATTRIRDQRVRQILDAALADGAPAYTRLPDAAELASGDSQ